MLQGVRRAMQRPRVNARTSDGIPRAVSAPVSMASTVVNSQPKIAYSGRNSCRIAHRELIDTINHSVAFTTSAYPLNPGLASTFPWLAPMAAQWEQYRFLKLCFHYVTRTATTTIGSVLLAPDYDASDSAPSSEVNMASYQDCIEDVPWKNLACTLNAASMHVIQARKYLRTGAVPSGTDVKLYDVGNFFVGTTGGTSTDAIGKLYVEYEVEFYIPQKTSVTASSTSFAYTQASTVVGAGATANLFAAPTAVFAAATAPVGGAFTVPKGNWLIQYSSNTNAGDAYVLTILVDSVIQSSQTYTGNTTGGGALSATFALALSNESDVELRFTASAGAINLQYTRVVFSALM